MGFLDDLKKSAMTLVTGNSYVKSNDKETEQRVRPFVQKANARNVQNLRSGQINQGQYKKQSSDIFGYSNVPKKEKLGNIDQFVKNQADFASRNPVIRPVLTGIAAASPVKVAGEFAGQVGRAGQAFGWKNGKYLAEAGDNVAGMTNAKDEFASTGRADSLTRAAIGLGTDVANSFNPVTRAATLGKYFTSTANEQARGMEGDGYSPQASFAGGVALGVPVALMERLSLGTIGGKAGGAVAQKIASSIPKKVANNTAAQVGSRLVGSGITEGSTEAAQQFLTNVGAKTTFDPNRGLGDDVFESGLQGAILGTGARGGVEIANQINTPKTKPPLSPELQNKRDGLINAFTIAQDQGRPDLADGIATQIDQIDNPAPGTLREKIRSAQDKVSGTLDAIDQKVFKYGNNQSGAIGRDVRPDAVPIDSNSELGDNNIPDQYVKEYADMLKAQESGLSGGQLQDTADGKIRTTQHSQFYRDFFKENKRKPSNKDWLEYAKQEAPNDTEFTNYVKGELEQQAESQSLEQQGSEFDTEGKPRIAYDIPKAPVETKKPFTPISQPVDNIPAVAKAVAPKKSELKVTPKPETGTPKLAQGVKENTLKGKDRGAKLSKDLEKSFDLPEYEKVNVADQTKSASELVKTDPQLAKDIAMGKTKAPGQLLPESVFIAVENAAQAANDTDTLLELATQSSLTSEATKKGQSIRMLAERDTESAVVAIQTVQKARQKANKKGLTKKRSSTVNDIKSAIKKKVSDKVSWNNFIKNLKIEGGTKQEQAFKQKLKDGTIDPIKLASMTSAERRAEFGKFLNDKNATSTNVAFERKLLLKNQQRGLLTWAESQSGLRPAAKRDLVSRVQRMTTILEPGDQDAFLQDLADQRLGVSVSPVEAKRISELSNAVKETEQNYTEENRLEYGTALVQFHQYVNGLEDNAGKTTFASLKQDIKSPTALVTKGVKAVADLMRSAKSSMDNSAIFRQGWKTMFTDNKIWRKNAVNSFPQIVNSIKGVDIQAAVDADILSRPNGKNGKYKKAKLATSNIEEAFPSDVLEKLPGIGRLYTASQDVYTAFLHRQRADIFDKLLEKAESRGVDIEDKAELVAIGKMVNSLTGRGDLGVFEPGADIFNSAFFSPRLAASHVDVLLLQPLGRGSKDTSRFAQKQAATNLVKIIGGTAAILAIASAFGDDDTVEWDPRSADFGQIKIGDTRFDVTGGMRSIVTLASRLVTQQTKSTSTGIVSDLNTGDFGSRTNKDVLFQWFENKASPAGGLVLTMLENENFDGSRPTVKSVLADSLLPIGVQNTKELLENPNSANNLLAITADFLGLSTNTYNADKDWSNNPTQSTDQFKEQLGEEKWKEANAKYNAEVRTGINDLNNSEDYKKLSEDDKQRVMSKYKSDSLKYVFGQYDFKPTSSTQPIQEVIESIGDLDSLKNRVENKGDNTSSESTQSNQTGGYKKFGLAEIPSSKAINDLNNSFSEAVSEGRITDVNRDARERDLARDTYKSQLDDATSKFYSIQSDADMRRTIQAGNITQAQLKKAIEVDNALTEAGLQPYARIGKELRADYGFGLPKTSSKSGSSKESGSGSKSSGATARKALATSTLAMNTNTSNSLKQLDALLSGTRRSSRPQAKQVATRKATIKKTVVRA
jgi:hypothetical protein